MKAIISHPATAIIMAAVLQFGAWFFGGGALVLLLVAPDSLPAWKFGQQLICAVLMQFGATSLFFSAVQERMIDELLRRANHESR